jgi:organic radical activating enzyme
VPDQHIFCNTPWFEAHVYWDGSLGVCCQERHKLYPDTDTGYNIRDMGLLEWTRSQPVQQFREQILGDSPLSACTKCYQEEAEGGISRRLRANLKSVIFTRQAFDHSWQQSPHRERFTPVTSQTPVDLHIDLGNFCNLTCKMCHAGASSRIAQQQVIWGNTDSKKFVGQDWTRDRTTWNQFLEDLLELPNLENLHFMGGETVLTPRFAELLDWLIQHKRTDIRISFVTNGTRWRDDVMSRLSQFRGVGAEISIESVTAHNDYVRQGSDTQQVLQNIARYQSWANGESHTVTLRSAPQALTMGSYHTLLNWALEQRLIIKANVCMRPEFMQVRVLPQSVREQYRAPYQDLVARLSNVDIDGDYNTSNPNAVEHSVKEQAQLSLGLLSQPAPVNQSQLLQQLFQHCAQWDTVGTMQFAEIYPELLNHE